jgi:hypothetical protein
MQANPLFLVLVQDAYGCSVSELAQWSSHDQSGPGGLLIVKQYQYTY